MSLNHHRLCFRFLGHRPLFLKQHLQHFSYIAINTH